MTKSGFGVAAVLVCLVPIVESCGSDTGSGPGNAAGSAGEGGAGGESVGEGGKDGGAKGGMPDTVGGGGGAAGQAGAGPSGTSGDTSAGGIGGAPDPSADAGSSGDGGQAGAGGAACGEVADPACDDGDATSLDFHSQHFDTCGHWFSAGSGDSGWIVYGAVGAPIGDTFAVDVTTGLGWANINGSRNQADAATACAALTRFGLADWRLATISEARTLAGGCAPTASDGTCPVADAACLAMSCAEGIACESCPGGAGSTSPRADGEYCRVEVNLCTLFQTSSSCTDCATPQAWVYGPTNGNFSTMSVASSVATVCVMPDVPGAPCLPSARRLR